MTTSNAVTYTDLENILNEVLPYASFRWESLGSKSSNGNFTLSESIFNYDIIVVTVYDTSYSAIHGCNFTTPAILKTYNSTTKAFGFSGYQSARIYAYTNYVNDTTLNAQVASGCGVYVYGLLLGTSVRQIPPRTLLWTNSSPSSDFTSQTVVNASSYDAIEVSFYHWKNSHRIIQVLTIPKGEQGLAIGVGDRTGADFSGGGICNIARSFEFKANGDVAIYGGAECYDGGVWTQSQNHVLIPYQVHGIKYA